jgi:hypothetical protein
MLATKPFQYWRSFRDPTVTQIPLVGKNPVAPMFADVKKFRFADDGSVDFQGLPLRNQQHQGGTLSDSNERASKGFVPTFSMQRSMGRVSISTGLDLHETRRIRSWTLCVSTRASNHDEGAESGPAGALLRPCAHHCRFTHAREYARRELNNA